MKPPPWIQTTRGAGTSVAGTHRSSCNGRNPKATAYVMAE
jgi:hypothetical protein